MDNVQAIMVTTGFPVGIWRQGLRCWLLGLIQAFCPFWRTVRLLYQPPSVLFSHNKSATSNQPTVLFSQNKSAPTKRKACAIANLWTHCDTTTHS
jgi:hypothetical protein